MRQTCKAILVLASGLSCAAAAAPASAATYKLLHSFNKTKSPGVEPTAGSLLRVGTKLYGMTTNGSNNASGSVYSLTPSSGAAKAVYQFGAYHGDAGAPVGGLIDVNGLLFGASLFGGSANFGTVFSVNPKTHAETIVYSFQGGSSGGGPCSHLLNVPK